VSQTLFQTSGVYFVELSLWWNPQNDNFMVKMNAMAMHAEAEARKKQVTKERE